MSDVKFPKKLLESCQQKNITKIQNFFLTDKLGRYTCWSKPIIENFGFDLFKNSMLDWEHDFFVKKYKQDLINNVMFLACEGNEDCQNYIIKNKIPFNESTIFYLYHLFENVQDKKSENIASFLEALKKIEHPAKDIFNPKSTFFSALEGLCYKKTRALQMKDFFNMDFSQEHKDGFLRWSAINLDWRSCEYWISEGADIMLNSIQKEDEKPATSINQVISNVVKGSYQKDRKNGFWAFDARHLRVFNKGSVFAGQDSTFEILIKSCNLEQKSVDNPLWEKTATNIIEQLECDSAKRILRIAIKNNAKFSLSWFKNENEAAKFIEYNFDYGGLELLKEWVDKSPKNEKKLIQMVYKQAVINGCTEMCEKLVLERFDPTDFINSDAFKNISQNGSMTSHIKNSHMLDHIEKSRRIIQSFYLHQNLSETLNEHSNRTPSKKSKI